MSSSFEMELTEEEDGINVLEFFGFLISTSSLIFICAGDTRANQGASDKETLRAPG